MHFKDIVHFEDRFDRDPSYLHLLNKLLKKLKSPFLLTKNYDGMKSMLSYEQRLSIFHLCLEIINNKIEGEWIEFGTYTGQSAIVIQQILDKKKTNKQLICFDNFLATYGNKGNIKNQLIERFNKFSIRMPQLIEGNFEDTIENNIPSKIAFVHIDCGNGGPKEILQNRILHILNNVYDHLTSGAIILFMDYHDEQNTIKGFNINPGVKLACDEFFKDKLESVTTLYGNQYSFGFIKKI